MPAPTNTSAATATDLGSLPASATQDVHDSGTTYTVWYKVTVPSGVTMLGAFGFGDLTTYRPTISVFEGPPEAPESLLGIAAQNRPVQFPVTAAETYYLRFATNSGNPTPASLSVSVIAGPADAAQAGFLLVPDDTDGFPAAIVDPSTGEVAGFVHPFPAGEWGDTLDDGTILVEDKAAGRIKRYDDAFALQTTLEPFPSVLIQEHVIRISPALQTFYVGGGTTGITGAKITVVDGDGVQSGTTWTLPAAGLTALAPNNDGSIVYVAGQTSSVNTPIKRWQTGSSTMGTDLIGGQGANTEVFDLLVLGDDTIIAGWLNTSTGEVTVKHLSAAGTLLGTFTGSSVTYTPPKLAYDHLSDTTHFYLWTHTSDTSTHARIAVATMTAASSSSTPEYEGGAYQGSATATPTARFGISFSCPFLVLRGGGGGPDPEPDDEAIYDESLPSCQLLTTIARASGICDPGPVPGTGLSGQQVLGLAWTVGDCNRGALAEAGVSDSCSRALAGLAILAGCDPEWILAQGATGGTLVAEAGSGLSFDPNHTGGGTIGGGSTTQTPTESWLP